MTPPLAPLLDAKDVAARLRVDVRTVQRLAQELGARRICGKLRFRSEDVLAYEDRRQMRPDVKEPTPITAPRRAALKHDTPTNPLDGLPWEMVQ